DVYFTDTGDLEIKNESQTAYVYDRTLDLKSQILNLINKKTGETIDRIGAFAEVVSAKVRAGLIEAKKLVVDGVDILKKLNELSDKSDKQQKIIENQQKQIEELQRTVKELKK
ncbi:hypothetical protein COY62_03295, partial [bacterium (Candidatus Howlettbacteria) CG_4_10_14_0_8_um_filter_40_9]